MALVESVRPRVSYTDLCQQPEDGRRYEIYDGEYLRAPSETTEAQRRGVKPFGELLWGGPTPTASAAESTVGT